MKHPLLFRALMGTAGLAGCVVLLSGVAKAGTIPSTEPPIIVSKVIGPTAPVIAGTLTIAVKPERYLDDWERARRDDSRDPRMQELIAPARGLNPVQQLQYLQRAVFRRVHWMSDATEWGAHDYWASAAETLSHNAGDEEDRAIVKMQALRALGFPNRDLFMTMGRDKAGGQVTVLIVRVAGKYWVLDDNEGGPYTTDQRPEFRPMLTFGYGGFWIHGYPYARRQAVAANNIAGASAR